MDKKGYTPLSEVDHKMQFVTLIGVIDEITPVIKRNKKMLGQVLVEISDTTLSNPGFCTELNFECQVLDEFLAVAKKSLIIEFLNIKVAKNEGVIRGEVYDEEEVRLYNDDGSRLKWWLDEKTVHRNSERTKHALKELKNWKKTNIEDNSEKLKVETKKHEEKVNLQIKLLNLERSRYSNEFRKRSIADKNISISSEGSPNDGDKKKRANLSESNLKDGDKKKKANLNESSSIDKDNNKNCNSSEINPKDGFNKKKANSVGKANTKTNISLKESPKDSNIKRKRKVLDKKNEESRFDSPDISKKKKLTTSPRSLRGVTDNSVKHDKSVSQLNSSNNNATAQSNNREKNENKIVDRKCDQDKEDRNIVKRTSMNSPKSTSNDSSLNLEKERRLHKNESSISDNDSSKNSNLKKKTGKEKLTLPKSKDHILNSTSHSLSSSSSINSVDSNISINEVPVISSPVKKNIIGKSQKNLVKQHEKSNESKEIRNKSPIITKETNNLITQSSGSKVTRSNSSTNISQLKVQERKGTSARYSSPLRNRVLNTSIGKLNEDIESIKQKKNKPNSLPGDKVQEIVDLDLQTKPSAPRYSAVNSSKEGGEITSNTDKTKNVDSKLNDSCKTKTLESPLEEPSKQDVSNKNITTLMLKNLVNKKSISPRISDQEKTLKRKSKSVSNDVETYSDKKGIISRLSSFTRKIHIVEVETNGDVSFCDIEDVDVPEKMDLQCKVLSDFYLFEDNIQVIRVIDGTICKTPTLCIPQKGSWEEIVATVVESPTIKKTSPFIDIIIFDFPLMDQPVVSGEVYDFKNIMAIRLNFKDKQRKGATAKRELFFCTKGQNIYNKKLRQKLRQEIDTRLGDEKYKQLLAECLENKELNKEKTDKQLEDELSSCKKSNVCYDEPLHIDRSLQKTSSPTNKKRKITEPEMDVQAPMRKKQEMDSEDKTTEKQAVRNKDTEKLPKPNPVALTDETILGETECLIIKELSEIMHEGSGLPHTLTDDIHLKNSGSEVTFSQFCAGAEGKSSNFRTSTQVDMLSEDIVPLNWKEVSPTPDSSKMEPLVYSPSSCSLSDIVSPKKPVKSPRKAKDIEQCSESIIESYKVKPMSGDQPTSPSVESCSNIEKHVGETLTNQAKDVEELSPDLLTNNSSLFVEVLSSNSSVVEVVINQEGKNTINEIKPSEDVQNLRDNVSEESPMKLPQNGTSIENELEDNSLNNSLDKEIEGVSSDNEDDMSILNSTVLGSPFRNNIQSVTSEKPFYVQFSKSNNHEVMDTNIESNHYNKQYPSSFDNGKKIVDNCFFQSGENRYHSTEEVNHIFNEENNSLKFFSYSHGQHLPFLTFDVIHKLENSNYITVAVTIEKIVPPITDLWKVDCIKARCPCCNKLYNAYNALNNKSSKHSTSLNALYIRGFFVCPESQCCNQVLEPPEFHFTVDSKLKDGSLVTALIAGTYAEQLFGCKAQYAARDETALSRIEGILQRLAVKMDNKQFVKMDFRREDICNPNSGPLYISKIHF